MENWPGHPATQNGGLPANRRAAGELGGLLRDAVRRAAAGPGRHPGPPGPPKSPADHRSRPAFSELDLSARVGVGTAGNRPAKKRRLHAGPGTMFSFRLDRRFTRRWVQRSRKLSLLGQNEVAHHTTSLIIGNF